MQDGAVFSLVYMSSTATVLSPAELADLLAKCHVNNVALGITGMLLYKDGNVMQVLEGEEHKVRALYHKIGKDPRHRGLQTLVQGPVTTRSFPDWSMGFRTLANVAIHDAPGYSEFLNTPLTAAEFSADPTRCQRLLTTFKKNM